MDKIVITAVGDVMIGDSAICVGWGFNSSVGHTDFRARMSPLTAFADCSDLLVGNLETVLSDIGVGRTRLEQDQMRAGAVWAHSLKEAGFDVLSVANNHAMQHGISGFNSTVSALRSVDIAVAGLKGQSPWNCAPVVLKRKQVKIGVLAYCFRQRQYFTENVEYAEGTVETVTSDVLRLSQLVDCVVLSLHWGDEFVSQPSSWQVHFARSMVEAGASLVVGHHPHILQPIESWRQGVIAYSLGNIVSDMLWMADTRIGGAVRCTVSRENTSLSAFRRFCTRMDLFVEEFDSSIPPLHEEGVPLSLYSQLVSRGLSKQRAAAYRYLMRNALRYPYDVLFHLVSQTIGNKARGLLGRSR